MLLYKKLFSYGPISASLSLRCDVTVKLHRAVGITLVIKTCRLLFTITKYVLEKNKLTVSEEHVFTSRKLWKRPVRAPYQSPEEKGNALL